MRLHLLICSILTVCALPVLAQTSPSTSQNKPAQATSSITSTKPVTVSKVVELPPSISQQKNHGIDKVVIAPVITSSVKTSNKPEVVKPDPFKPVLDLLAKGKDKEAFKILHGMLNDQQVRDWIIVRQAVLPPYFLFEVSNRFPTYHAKDAALWYYIAELKTTFALIKVNAPDTVWNSYRIYRDSITLPWVRNWISLSTEHRLTAIEGAIAWDKQQPKRLTPLLWLKSYMPLTHIKVRTDWKEERMVRYCYGSLRSSLELRAPKEVQEHRVIASHDNWSPEELNRPKTEPTVLIEHARGRFLEHLALALSLLAIACIALSYIIPELKQRFKIGTT